MVHGSNQWTDLLQGGGPQINLVVEATYCPAPLQGRAGGGQWS